MALPSRLPACPYVDFGADLWLSLPRLPACPYVEFGADLWLSLPRLPACPYVEFGADLWLSPPGSLLVLTSSSALISSASAASCGERASFFSSRSSQLFSANVSSADTHAALTAVYYSAHSGMLVRPAQPASTRTGHYQPLKLGV